MKKKMFLQKRSSIEVSYQHQLLCLERMWYKFIKTYLPVYFTTLYKRSLSLYLKKLLQSDTWRRLRFEIKLEEKPFKIHKI